MNRMLINKHIVAVMKAIIITCLASYYQPVMADRLPDKLAAAIIIKIIEFEKEIRDKKLIRIHVIADDKMLEYLKMYQGNVLGKGVVSSITFGDALPDRNVDVVLIGKTNNITEIISKTRKVNVLSMSTEVEYSAVGVSVVVFDDEGVPGILLNTVSSKLEGASWDPEILEIANIIENYSTEGVSRSE